MGQVNVVRLEMPHKTKAKNSTEAVVLPEVHLGQGQDTVLCRLLDRALSGP